LIVFGPGEPIKFIVRNADAAPNVRRECWQWVQVDLEQCEGLP